MTAAGKIADWALGVLAEVPDVAAWATTRDARLSGLLDGQMPNYQNFTVEPYSEML
jgi:hypothetical protein